MSASALRRVATSVALAGSSWVSPSTSSIVVLLALLKSSTASLAKFSCSWPIEAAGPVKGPMTPILIVPPAAVPPAAVGSAIAVGAAASVGLGASVGAGASVGLGASVGCGAAVGCAGAAVGSAAGAEVAAVPPLPPP